MSEPGLQPRLLPRSPAPFPPPLHFVGALAGAGGEAVVQRVAEGAHGVGPPAGGGGLVRPAAVLLAPARLGVPVATATARDGVRVQAAAARAAVVQPVQGLRGEVQGARRAADGRLVRGDVLLRGERGSVDQDGKTEKLGFTGWKSDEPRLESVKSNSAGASPAISLPNRSATVLKSCL